MKLRVEGIKKSVKRRASSVGADPRVCPGNTIKTIKYSIIIEINCKSKKEIIQI